MNGIGEERRVETLARWPSSVAAGRRPVLLLVGDFAHRDFSEAAAWLRGNAATHQAAGACQAVRWLQEGGRPEVVLFAQARPGEFLHSEVELVHAQAPLARLVVLLGSWCEGETRTGRPWPGVVRVAWHQWRPRMISELAAAPGWPRGTWRLPRTASLSEQLACAAESRWPQNQGLVSIYARLRVDFEGLRDACAAGGYASTWCRQSLPSFCSAAQAVLYDAISGGEAEAAEVARLVVRHSRAPVIALLDFVRRQDAAALTGAGAAAVIAKPFLVADLLWHLDRQLAAARVA